MRTRSVVPLYELEAPGLERTRLSTTALVLLIPLLMVLLILVTLLAGYHFLSKKASAHQLRHRTTDLRISFRKLNF